MKKYLLLLSGVLLLFSAPILFAKAEENDDITIYVDASVPGPGNGTSANPYGDMEQALEELANPDNPKYIVKIAGTFWPLNLNTAHSGTETQPNVFEQWEGKEPAVFDADFGTFSAIATNGASHIRFRGLTGKNASQNPGGLGLFINSSTDIEASGMTLTNDAESGICTSGSSDVLIENSVFEQNGGNGLLIPDSTNVVVRNNVFRNNAGPDVTGGIFVNESTNVTIIGNTISGNLNKGILGNNLHSGNIEENLIFDNRGDGIELGGYSENVSVTNNTILGNSGKGISARATNTDVSKATIAGNVLANNGDTGLSIIAGSLSATVYVVNNTVLDNGQTGMYIQQFEAQLRVFNNMIGGHDTGAQFITIRPEFFASNNNNLFGNTVVMEWSKKMSGDWRSEDEWRNIGKDKKSLTVDPQFSENATCLGATCTQYHLSENSRLIDAGKVTQDQLSQDIDGDSRVIGRVDIGADEYVPLVN